MKKLKTILLNLIPRFIYVFLVNLKIKLKIFKEQFKENQMIRNQPKLHKKALKRLRKKVYREEKIKVAFFAIYSSVWKYEGIYRLFENDERFEPIVVVCPVVNYGMDNMIYEMDKAYTSFKDKGYSVLRTYNEDMNKYLDVKKEINPDIIFYTNPYKGLIDDRYYITQYKDILTCYVNYAFFVSNLIDVTYNNLFPNLLWCFFHETEIHLKMAKYFSENQGINGIVTGYPGVDEFTYGMRENHQIWKNSDISFKRIIWAPHHTIEEEGWLMYSNFLSYYDFMIEIAEKYKNLIQFSFKPHPLLKVKLYNHEDWGKKRTDEYYQRWESGQNTQLNVDSYNELFNSSDALIHDSGSFTAEYLHCGKPLLFTVKEKTKEQFNEFGLLALDQHYHAFSAEDIKNFIEEVVLGGKDPKERDRDEFYYKVLKGSQSNSASVNIYQFICEKIFD